MLTGKELVEQGIIVGMIPSENIQQHGVDLNLIKVEKLCEFSRGIIPLTGKTKLVEYEEVALMKVKDGDLGEIQAWVLEPGAYNITLQQGCKIPADKMLLIRQRSSLLRNGTLLHSSVFDAGFETKRIGTVMYVTHPITIQFYARVGQIYAHDSNIVENLYDGQFQGDKQRVK